MANFNFLRPINANLNSSFDRPFAKRKRLTFSRNNGPIIYTNYPEALTAEGKNAALAEKGYCTNEQEISPGEAMVFFSHRNETGQRLKYRVRIQNISNGSARVTRSNIGFSYGWNPAPTVEDYYQTSYTTINISGKDFAWLTPEYSIPNGQPFNGMVKITTNQRIKITLYAYLKSSAINSNEVVYPYSDKYADSLAVFSGKGNGFFLTVNHGVINLKDMPYHYITNTKLLNQNEITDIKIAGTSLHANEYAKYPLNNLANWCTQNYHTMTLHNDTNDKQTVYGYIISHNTPVVAHGSDIASYRLGAYKDHTWKWCKIILNPNEYYPFDWQTILSSYGAGEMWHEWSLEDKMKK